jgi:Ca2+-binding EF-hand superfamily protein
LKGPSPEDPLWLHFMSMPKLKQHKYFGQTETLIPDNCQTTKKSYKQLDKKVRRAEEAVQSYDPIYNLNDGAKLRLGTSILTPHYDPDMYVEKGLQLSQNTDSHLRPIWTMRDVENQKSPRTINLSKTEKLPKNNAVTLLSNFQEKCQGRRDWKDLVRMFDNESKGYVTEADVKNVFDSMGFVYEPTDPAKLLLMASGNQNKATRADMLKLVQREKVQETFGDKSIEQLGEAQNIDEKKRRKDGVMAVLTNDIRRVHKALDAHTEKGFIPAQKAKEILKQSAKQWQEADLSAIDEIVNNNTTALGVDCQELVQTLADNNLKRRIERENIKLSHSQQADPCSPVFEQQHSDNTVKRYFSRLDQALVRRNPVQLQLLKKYKSPQEIMSAIGDKPQMSKAEIFDFYKQALGKDNLDLEDKQRIYKFTETLRFRDDDNKVAAQDFADLVFGQIKPNARLRESERRPLPVGPGEPELSADVPQYRPDHQEHRPLLPRLNPPREMDDVKKLADKLGFTLNSKVSNSYDMFKYFDRDDDGVVRKAEFQTKLTDIGLCSGEQAGHLFDALRKDANSPCLDFKTFHTGFRKITGDGGNSIDTSGFQLMRPPGQSVSLPQRRALQQPLDAAAFRKSKSCLTQK